MTSGPAIALEEGPRATGSGPEAFPSLRHDRLWMIGVALISLQGIGMMAWSYDLWTRFAVTWDFALSYQAWWLIAHGHLDPFSTVLGFPYLDNNFKLLVWPLALLQRLSPPWPDLQWLQDLGLVGAELVVWRWMREATLAVAGIPSLILAGGGVLLLLLNPWAWWTISFDFHLEPIALFFLTMAAYDLYHRRKRMWVWVALAMASTEVAASWLPGLGLAALIVGGGRRRAGIALIVVGAGWVLFVDSIHGDQGASLLGTYGYLAGPTPAHNLTGLVAALATHPGRVLLVLWAHRVDIWSNLAPGGLLGIANPWTLGMSLPVLLANNLVPGAVFAQPLFQSVPLYVLLPLGTVLVLTALHRRWPRLAVALTVVTVANAAIWTAVWIPQLPGTWLRVPPASAAVLRAALARMPPSDEVVGSQGVMGQFSARPLVYPILYGGEVIPLKARTVWFVLAPSIGIETAPSIDMYGFLHDLSGLRGSRVVLAAHGVFVVHLTTQPHESSVQIPRGLGELPAWALPGPAGRAVMSGPETTWHLVSRAAPGYVLSGDYWRESPRSYVAVVDLRSRGPVTVEVWNDSGGVLLARRELPSASGPVVIPVSAERVYPKRIFQGWGPFSTSLTPPAGGDRLEIRVWTPGGSATKVWWISLRAAR